MRRPNAALDTSGSKVQRTKLQIPRELRSLVMTNKNRRPRRKNAWMQIPRELRSLVMTNKKRRLAREEGLDATPVSCS